MTSMNSTQQSLPKSVNLRHKANIPQQNSRTIEILLQLNCIWAYFVCMSLSQENTSTGRQSCFPTNPYSSKSQALLMFNHLLFFFYLMEHDFYAEQHCPILCRPAACTYVCCFRRDHSPCFLQSGYPWILLRVSKETLPRILSMPA